MTISGIIQKLIRKKVLSDETVQETDLKRCLTTLDLIGLGIGSTLGAGLYVVSGQVAHKDAGPAVIISFLIAAVASAFAGLCYAEFAARIPRAGSAYVYSYVTVGEFMAFVIGWNLVLEYVIGTASVARGWSGYVDSLADNKISHFFNTSMHMDIPQLSPYPDFLAFFMTLLVTVVLSAGVKESTRFNNIFTTVNLLVVLYITLCGVFKIDWGNWALSADEVPEGAGSGGFMPYGFSKMMAGAATCFYAFVGFDAIATTGEETKNPQKSIPIAIIVSLIFIFISYFCVSGIMTLMCPYYLLDVKAPLPEVFKRVGWGVARYVISTGAIAGLTTSLLGAMFPLPRVLYAMGTDGVIFRFMGKIHPRFQTPLMGTAISGVFSGLMAMLFDLEELVNMMSIGTLLAYTLVAISVLILRYECDENDVIRMSHQALTFKFRNLFQPEVLHPSPLTSRITKVTIMCLFVILAVLSAVLIFCEKNLTDGEVWSIVVVSFLGILAIVGTLIIFLQPQSTAELSFRVPFLPGLPVLSTFINVYLMLKLSLMTWIRFIVWLVIGLIIYIVAGYKYEGRSQPNNPESTNAFDKPMGEGGNGHNPRAAAIKYHEKTHLLQ